MCLCVLRGGCGDAVVEFRAAGGLEVSKATEVLPKGGGL